MCDASWSSAANPIYLFRLSCIKAFPDRIWIVQRPDGELLEHFDLGENIKVVKLGRCLLGAEGVTCRGFGHELAPCVFIEDFGSIIRSVYMRARQEW